MTDYEQEVLTHLQNINANVARYNDNMGGWTKWEKDQITTTAKLSKRVYWLNWIIVALTVVIIVIMVYQFYYYIPRH